jgi:hypothetical protein
MTASSIGEDTSNNSFAARLTGPADRRTADTTAKHRDVFNGFLVEGKGDKECRGYEEPRNPGTQEMK